MCTLSWVRGEEGYELFFNRDERRTRGSEIAPAESVRDGVRILAPRDADFGGTWIAVNEHGTSVCVLNGAAPAEAPAGLESRGQLVLELATASDANEAAGELTSVRAARFRPFVLVVLDPASEAFVAEWDGRALAIDARAEARMPVISSSFAEEAVRAMRTESFRARREGGRPLDAATLRACHASHDGGPSAYSVCMHREDAETKSFARIRVARDRVEFEYTPGPPCRTAARAPVALARRA